MVDDNPGPGPGDVALALLGEDIPAIGPRHKTRLEAVLAVKKHITAIEGLIRYTAQPYRVMFSRQPDGRYMMIIKGSCDALEVLHNLDELTVKRFKRSFKNRMFILTSFFEEGGRLECLALTEGMGAVLYIPR